MRSIQRMIFTAACLLLVAGCASKGDPIDPKDETLSMVFGYFDMKEAPSDLRWVSIKKYGDKPLFYEAGAKEGLFWHVGIAPGSYQVETFGGQGGIPMLTSSPYRYNFGTRGRNDTAVRVRRPGLYFMGVYRYVEHKGGFMETDRFEMKPAKAPSEKEVLQRLIKEMESDDELRIYTRQLAWAKKRVAELSR
jgi:hypothetical protein